LERVAKQGRAYIAENDLPLEIEATTSRPEALACADFCIISIEVGDRFALWEQDWRIPLQYGIRQVYGENGGPGGLFHSLRIIPPILEICGDVREICPDAVVFNYSNPMSRICTTVHRKYPDLHFVGLCHEIFSLPHHLPKMLETPLSNLEFRAAGLNHFSVLLEVHYKDSGKDAYPDVRQKAPAYFQNRDDLNEWVKRFVEEMPASQAFLSAPGRQWSERGLFRVILERFGYMPITTDSHFGEYIQWAHDVVDHERILDFYEWYKMFCQQRGGGISDTPEMKERVVPIIEGIVTDAGFEEMAVNVPNQGAIANLPDWIVPEVPAIIDANGVTAVELGELPKGIAGLLMNQVAVHDLTAEAVLTGSKDVVLQALLVDPVVWSVRAAEQALDVILKVQSDYLGYIE
jgi:alpha-galactosidase